MLLLVNYWITHPAQPITTSSI